MPSLPVVSPPQGGSPQDGTASPPQGGVPHSNTFVLNQTVVNDGCNFGHVSMQATNVAIEQVVLLAEARHQTTVIQMQDAAVQEHFLHMANLQREAEHALQRQAE